MPIKPSERETVKGKFHNACTFFHKPCIIAPSKGTQMNLQMKQIRVKRGMGQKEVADLVNMTVRRYGSYERGERAISLDDAARIADVLQCSLDELADRSEFIGRFSDANQVELNKLYQYLDEPNKSAAVGAVRGIAANQSREKSEDAGVAGNTRRTA